MIFDILSLPYLAQHNDFQFYSFFCKWYNFFFMAESYSIMYNTTFSLPIHQLLVTYSDFISWLLCILLWTISLLYVNLHSFGNIDSSVVLQGHKVGLFLGFFGDPMVWTQVFALDTQALYHFIHAFSPFCSGYFADRTLLFPWLAWNHDHPDLSITSS
jgi:hypothetical protein